MRRHENRIDARDVELCVGKTLRSVVVSSGYDKMILVFTDGTLSQITAESDDNIADITSGFDVDLVDYNLDKLLAAGAVTQEVFEAIKVKVDEAETSRCLEVEAEERIQYERLKAKFEPSAKPGLTGGSASVRSSR